MSRAAARTTQADIARAIRAARQNSCCRNKKAIPIPAPVN